MFSKRVVRVIACLDSEHSDDILVGAEEISQRNEDDDNESKQKSQCVEENRNDSFELVVDLEINEPRQVNDHEQKRHDEIVDAIFHEWPAQCCDKWKPEAIDDVATHIENHDEASRCETHDKEGTDSYVPHIFWIEKKIGCTET